MTTPRDHALSGDVAGTSEAERGLGAWGPLVLVAAVAALTAAAFLPHQTLWVDETTQLSGMTLSPGEVFRWLTHPQTHDFGVPGDRMPPISYWGGWAWSHLFGLNETALRWFGVVATSVAAALLCSAARRAYGLLAGLFAGLFLALSPNVVVTAVEIRAYPLFLLTTCGALRALVLLLEVESADAQATFSWRRPSPGRARWIALGVWLLLGMYVHFFSLLFGGAVLALLGLRRLSAKRSLTPVLGVGGVLALGAIGLVPFVIASVGLSGVTVRDRTREVVQLLYRLISHPAMSVHPAAVALAFVAAAGLTVLALRNASPARFMAAVLAIGIAVSIAANFVVGGFTAAKVSYSTWALPVLALVLAGAFVQRSGKAATAALVAAAVLLASEAAGSFELARHGDHFAHGPHRGVQQVLDASVAAGRTAVLYADPVGAYAAIYFPLRFADGAGLDQFVVAEGDDKPTLGTVLDAAGSPWDDRLRGYSRLVVVRARTQSAQQLVSQLRRGDEPFPASRTLEALEASGKWHALEHHQFTAFIAADVTVLERQKEGR